MDFGDAIRALKDPVSKRVTRSGWNGKGMYLLYVGASDWDMNPPHLDERGSALEPAPFIAMRTASGTLVPWLASQADILAEDWQIVE